MTSSLLELLVAAKNDNNHLLLGNPSNAVILLQFLVAVSSYPMVTINLHLIKAPENSTFVHALMIEN